MKAKVSQFRQIFRIHAWITVSLLVLLLIRSVWVGIASFGWLAGLMCLLLFSLVLWPHLLAVLRNSKAATLIVVVMDLGFGAWLLYVGVQFLVGLWDRLSWTMWGPSLLLFGLGLWLLSAGIIHTIHHRLLVKTEGGGGYWL